MSDYVLELKAWKSERKFNGNSGRGIGFVPDASGRFFLYMRMSVE